MADFRPNSVLVEPDGTEVRMTFARDDGQHQVVVLGLRQLPSHLTELQKQISPTDAVPINKGSLRAGNTIQVSSLGFGPRVDHFLVTVHADLPDEGRSVSIPLAFSEDDARACVKAMTTWLSKLNATDTP